MADFPQPWWTRASNVSVDGATGSSGCKFRTLVSTECKVELNEEGKPQRKCQRIFRKFKECQGRPAEVVERVEESTTEPNFKQESDIWRDFDSAEKGPGDVISSEMGQLLEEVLAAFENDFLLDGDSMHARRNPMQWPPGDFQHEDEANTINEGLFNRLFGKKNKKQPSGPGSPRQHIYKEYASDFQEV